MASALSTLSALSDEESGVRRMPSVEDDLRDLRDLPDLTDALQELREIDDGDAPERGRRATPPPIPDDAFNDVSLVDFAFVAKTCGPKTAGWQAGSPSAGPFPAVPGIPTGFRVTPVPPAPRAFDYELALHIAVVWGSALAAGIIALF